MEARFPLFVDLHGARAVLVGGGAVSARRAGVLLRFGANITVIAPELRAPFPPEVVHLPRPYQAGDLAGAVLAVAATDSRAVNRSVGEEARERGIPVSVADCPKECTFFFPAICEGGDLVAGVVSKSGDHRGVAAATAAIRRMWEEDGWM